MGVGGWRERLREAMAEPRRQDEALGAGWGLGADGGVAARAVSVDCCGGGGGAAAGSAAGGVS